MDCKQKIFIYPEDLQYIMHNMREPYAQADSQTVVSTVLRLLKTLKRECNGYNITLDNTVNSRFSTHKLHAISC